MFIPEHSKSNSPQKTPEAGLYSLISSHWSLATVVIASLLIFGCSGEESVDIPIVESVGEAKLINDAPTSTPYYPMTFGSRWVYRNPDGSEWTREVTETKRFGDNLFHFFSSDPPLQDTQVESLRSPVYVAFLNRLDRRLVHNDLGTAIREIIVDSGGRTPDWSIGMTCGKNEFRKPVCVSKKDKFNPGILAYLHNAKTDVIWNSKLTPLRFPLIPSQTFQSLELRLRGSIDGGNYICDYEAEGVILGKISGAWELVETPAGVFGDCVRIQYEARLASYRTLEFRHSILHRMTYRRAHRVAVESVTREELTDLLTHLIPKLGLHTVWLAPGVGPVKIETLDGIAELIDYEMTTVATSQ